MVVLLFSDDLVIGIESNAARPFRQRPGDYFSRRGFPAATLSRATAQASRRDTDACDHTSCDAIVRHEGREDYGHGKEERGGRPGFAQGSPAQEGPRKVIITCAVTGAVHTPA
jgi:hypothetical protein